MDAQLSHRLQSPLAAAGYEAIHVDAIGLGTATDPQIAEAAVQLGRIVLTQDRDFGALLAQSRASRPSVVLLRFDRIVRPDEQVARIADALRAYEAELLMGAIVVVEDTTMRVRALPF
jgi:predicted nuclease of predicted toxin-antitoxin system